MENTINWTDLRCQFTIHEKDISHQCHVLGDSYIIVGYIAKTSITLCNKHAKVLRKKYRVLNV